MVLACEIRAGSWSIELAIAKRYRQRAQHKGSTNKGAFHLTEWTFNHLGVLKIISENKRVRRTRRLDIFPTPIEGIPGIQWRCLDQ